MDELIAALIDIMELEEGVLTPETRLDEVEEWDSLAMVTCMAIADEKFSKAVTGGEIAECVTVADLYRLMTS